MKRAGFSSKAKSKSKAKTKINIKAPPVPSPGSAKKVPPKKKDEPALDVEQQFILRLPPGPAMALKHDVQSGAMNLKDKLFIEIQPDQRHGLVRYGDQMLHSKLVDLPCIVESLKTTDNKTFYKTADICQMLICTEEDESNFEELESPKKKDKDRRYLYPHGLTPPLKNVRKRRFRKTLKKRYTEQPDNEKELKRLFRTDNEAVHVKWEIVVDDDKQLSDIKDEMGKEGETQAQKMQGDINIEHIFGEVSSSEEEEDDEKEVNIMDSGDEYMAGDRTTPASKVEPEEDEDEEDDDEQMTEDMENDIREKLEVLTSQIEELHNKQESEKEKINAIDNVALRERFQTAYDELVQLEKEKIKEYELLSSMLLQS